MKKLIISLVFIILLNISFSLAITGAPIVSNVTMNQSEGNVYITYDLKFNTNPVDCKISLLISDDEGLTFSALAHPDFLTGDIGLRVHPGVDKKIIWHLHDQYLNIGSFNISGDTYRARVIATRNDGLSTPQREVNRTFNDIQEYNIWASRHNNVGNLSVWNDASNLYIESSLVDFWLLQKTHLAVANSLDGIPRNRPGIPVPGLFPYIIEYDSLLAETTYVIQLDDYGFIPEDDIIIAIHSEIIHSVNPPDDNVFTAVSHIEGAGEVLEESAWGGDTYGPGPRWWYYADYTIQMAQIATPTFNPSGGFYEEEITVSIFCETDGATIYYTTDGNEPTEESLMYDGPITVSETTTLKAKAFKEHFESSETAIADFTFDGLMISLSDYSGAPGSILILSTDQELSNTEDYLLHFNDSYSPLLRWDELEYQVIVPVVPVGHTEVYLRNIQDNSLSNTLSFDVLPLPETGLPPGEVAANVVDLYKGTVEVIRDIIMPNFNAIDVVNDYNLALVDFELDRAIHLLNLMEQEIQSLSNDEKAIFDQLLFSSGMYDFFEISASEIRHFDRNGSIYNTHYLLATLDSMSAILTFSNRVLTLGGAAATIASGGTLGPVFTIGVIALSIVDNFIDAFIPTDLEELFVDHDILFVPLDGFNQVRIMGVFETQNTIENFAISSFVSVMTGGLGLDAFETLIIDALTALNVEVYENISSIGDDWQPIEPPVVRVDPAYYTGGFNSFQNVMSSYGGVLFSGGSLLNFLVSNIASVDFYTVNPNIGSFNANASSIYGWNEGSSSLVYGGYRFKGFEGVLGFFARLLGIEWPQQLESNQIGPCFFQVIQIDETSITINSYPEGATIYLNGTNMNVITPAVLENLMPGDYHVRLYKIGYNEYNEYFTLSSGVPYFINVDLGYPIPPLPVFTINHPLDGQTFTNNVINVSGHIQLQDALGNYLPFPGNHAILTLNGIDQVIPVSSGQFNTPLSILSGGNTIQLRANSSNGDTGISDVITVYGDFGYNDIEITLTWNTPSADLDLHVWNPLGEHCYYANMTITEGSLDIDVLVGFGPETFTAPTALNGTYIVKVNAYYLRNDPYSDATVQVNLGGTVITYGPHRFYVHDFNGNNPDAWWNVTTFTVYNGRILDDPQPISQEMMQKVANDLMNLEEKMYYDFTLETSP